MPGFQHIEELIRELYNSRSVLSGLFEKRHIEIDVDMLMPFLDDDEEKLNRLVAHGIIGREKLTVYLDSRIREFFEEFLEVEEDVHVLYIQEYLDKIKEHKNYYLKSHREQKQQEHRQKIKHYLRRIIKVTVSNVKALRKNTEETYKGEVDFDVKKEKLTNLREQRDRLEGLLRAVENLLADDIFFKNAVDDELLYIIHLTKNVLHESRHNLLEIQQQIIEYLNQAMLRTEIIEKVLKLKSLKDKFQLRERSDFEEKAAQLPGLPASKREQFQSRLSLHAIFENEAIQDLIRKVQQKGTAKNKNLRETASPLHPDELDEKKDTRNTINLKQLLNMFQARNQDLFSFVMEYEHEEPLSESERISLYCKLASQYAESLTFTNRTASWNSLEYAVIYPENFN